MQNNEKHTDTGKFTMDYVLEQIEKIAQQTDYLTKTVDKLGEISVENGANNAAVSAKAEALTAVVQNRETTNQQLLRFYEKMYDDLKESTPVKAISLFEEMTDFLKSLNKDDFPEETWEYINAAVQNQLAFNAARGW